MTDLPASNYSTCILVIVNRLSKACCLIPLKGLPKSMEMAELLFNHFFRNFGLPDDIVLDRGPQFISQVWKALFSFLHMTVWLSSGYHPQTNREENPRTCMLYSHLLTQPLELLAWTEYAQNSGCAYLARNSAIDTLDLLPCWKRSTWRHKI